MLAYFHVVMWSCCHVFLGRDFLLAYLGALPTQPWPGGEKGEGGGAWGGRGGLAGGEWGLPGVTPGEGELVWGVDRCLGRKVCGVAWRIVQIAI